MLNLQLWVDKLKVQLWVELIYDMYKGLLPDQSSFASLSL